MKRLIIDVDDTICMTEDGDYKNSKPKTDVINKIKEYKNRGFEIVLYSSRNMRTFGGNTGKITIHTVPVLLEWLKQNEVPFDELYVGKPWCGTEGFYVDDKAIRPDEFATLSYDEIKKLLKI